ncbi:hypothetical protein [Streptomyces sp. TR06-5]|uniref:hypothetical protein n=1 Tax=unclassified Streptomyces TaxID=2593676 RepID=UPI0039A2EE7A
MSTEESAEERQRPHAWHQSPSMNELLASCAAADAVSTPPERLPYGEGPEERPEPDAPDGLRTAPRREAA